MQYTVLNCATMRMADITGLSGRVTADNQVNLDRFHSRIRKLCALLATQTKVYFSAATMILIVTLTVPGVGQVTFNGSLQGQERGIVKGTTQSTFGTVTGIVTNVGQFSFTYDDTINLTTGMGTGTGVLLSAKNGDSIFTNISGQFFPPFTPSGSTLSVARVTENMIIAGGTGRFKGATGQFTVERLIDFVDAQMDFDFTGGVIHNGTINFRDAESAQ